MNLIKDEKSVWETYMVEGFPFGIEKIDSRDFVVFRLWGSRRVYLREDGFVSVKQAMVFLVPVVEAYESSIVVAVTA